MSSSKTAVPDTPVFRTGEVSVLVVRVCVELRSTTFVVSSAPAEVKILRRAEIKSFQ